MPIHARYKPIWVRDWRIKKESTVRSTSDPMILTMKSKRSTPKKLNAEITWFIFTFLMSHFLEHAICLSADTKKLGLGHSGENQALVICQYE